MMMIVMMVAVAWNILLPLLLMFVIIWPKGLSNAQICSKSAETVCRVQKCPANQTEWDKAARRKDCSEIQKYNNCAKVEYHCLVNEFRNETIEVCTVLRHLQGYCPIYAENKAKNDYKKKCANQTPCNCSSGYLSTEAYKWQCCYSGINNDQDVKLFPNNYCRGKTIPAHSDKDQSNNLRVEVWLPPLLIAALVVLVGCSCVCYRMKRQNKTFLEALKIWENIPCTSLRSLQLDYRKKDRTDALERTPLQIEGKHTPFTGTTEVDGSKPEIQEALTPDGDSSNQGMSTSMTQEEIMSLNSETHVLGASSEKEVAKSLMSALPNEDGFKQGMPASDTKNKIKTPSVFETSAKKDSKLSTPESPNRDSSNQGMSASDTLEKIVTPVLETSAKEDSKSSTSESPNKDSSNQGMSASDTLEKIVTPVLETSAKEDSKSSTSESPNKDSSNQGMSASDTPNENGPKLRTSASKTTGGDISKSETSTIVLSERVENIRREMSHLKAEIDLIFGRGIWDLNYKLRSANLKIKSTERSIYGLNECADTAQLEMKASEVEKKLHQLRLIIQPMSKGFNQTNDKLIYPMSELEYKQVEDEDESEAKDNEAHKAEDGNLTYEMQLLTKYMKRKKDDVVLLDVDDSEGASSDAINKKKEVAFADKPFLEKLDHLKIRTEKLLGDVETLKNAVYARLRLGIADTILERLKEVEDDIEILSESYNLNASSPNHQAISRDKQLEELYKLYETLKKNFDELRPKVG